MKLEHHLSKLAASQPNAAKAAPVPPPSLPDFSGNWINELGSIAAFTQNADGTLTGTYTTAVSGNGNPFSGPISGYVDGNLIAFVVNWGDLDSITAWVGQGVLDNAGDLTSIFTLWQMTMNDPIWQSIMAGTDTFVPHIVIDAPGTPVHS